MGLSFISRTGAGLLDPLVELWNGFARVIPSLILAIIVTIFGYILAYIIGHAIKIGLQRAGLDKQVAKAKLTKAIGQVHISSLLGELVKWIIFIIFLGQAADIVKLGTLSILLNRFVLWLPNLIFAVVVLVFGLIFAHYVDIKVQEHAKVKSAKIASQTLRVIIIFIFGIIALEQINIDVSILKLAFLILVGGIALALGLAFGLGARNDAANWMKGIKRMF